jgi:hypothetical protein
MKIAATAVSMDAARTFREMEQRLTGLNQTTATADPSSLLDDFSVRLTRSLASSTQTQITARSVVGRINNGGDPPTETGNHQADASEQVLSQLAAQVLGQPVSIGTLQEIPAPTSLSAPPASGTARSFQVRGLELTSSTLYSQEETLLFSAQGSVQTTDGRAIAFELGLSMERTTVAMESSSFGVSNLFIDPLILQLDATSPLLGDRLFSFDMDGDGAKEVLACPGSGCGFLAFDRNRDGIINNGMELFGPTSGSGFGELAELDRDANQWIDEQDPLFAALLIWRPDGQGGESLQSLDEAGVGAIAVVHAGTGFELQRSDGTVLGTVKASGIFLTEAGEVRSLQEVDLALPAVPASHGPGGLQASVPRLKAALQSLRGIISMQRLRLQMMLAGQHLQVVAAKREEQRDWLSEWLQTRDHWQAVVGGAVQESSSAQDAEGRAAPEAKQAA